MAKKVVRTAKSRTVSINALLNNTESGDKTEQKKVVQTATQEQVTPFTFDELLVQWKKLQELFAGQPLYATLIAQKPVLKENYKVIVPLDHSIQEQQLWEIKPKIIGHLHRSLKNTKIEVEGVIMETERKRTILTDHEKLQKMIDENPVLAKFKQKFQLDLGES